MHVRRRSFKAQSAMELVCGAIVLIPLVLFCIDASTVYMGQSLNSTVCRDAARAAANGPPSSICPTLTPKQRAEVVVRRTQKTEGAIRLNPEVACTENVTRVPTMPFGGMVEGTVTVQTSVDVYPPFIIKYCVPSGAVKLSASQTYPFTWVMASAYGVSQNSVPMTLMPGGGVLNTANQTTQSISGGRVSAQSIAAPMGRASAARAAR